MKMINIKYILVAFAAMVMASCSNDEGNYDYTDINEVSVSGIEKGKTYTKMAFIDHLSFDPQINSTFGQNDESQYEYEWKLIPMGADFEKIDNVDELTVSRNRKIDMLVTMSPGNYSGFFIVKDKNNGVAWSTPFKLVVKSMTSEGWMVLCDVKGKARMDVIFNVSETDDLIASDIWQDIEFNPGKPEKLIFNYSLYQQASLLVTDKGTYNLDKVDLHVGEDNSMSWRFGDVPPAVHVKASAMSQFAMNNYWIIVDDKNDVYRLGVNESGSVFDYPINKLSGKERFSAAPFVGVSYDMTVTGCAPAVLYDDTNKQFVVMRNNAAYPSPMTFKSEALFSPQTNRDMVYMESTRSGMIYAILKDPATQKFYFYGMKLDALYIEPENWWEDGETEEFNSQEYYGEVNGAALENATMFACHHQFPYLFYVVGNSIYQFDMGHPEEAAKKVLSFPGETIKVMKFNPFVAWEAYATWERARGYQLVVATNKDGADDSECGTIRTYEVPNLMGDLVKKKEITKLGKIVDIAYKERSKR